MRSLLPRQATVVRLFFGLLLSIGGFVYSDYGLSTDEPAHYRHGLINLKYVASLVNPAWAAYLPDHKNLPPLQGYYDNGHGVLFELIAALLGLLLPADNPAAYYRMRHGLIFLVFVGGVWALYRLAALRLRSWRWGLVAATMLVLTPRMFAEGFYNGQDVVFMAMFTVAMFTLARLLQQPDWGRVLLHSLASAAAIDVRVLGSLLVFFTGVGLLSVALRDTWPARRLLLVGGTYLGASAAFTIAGWPFLWENPGANFYYTLRLMSRYPWKGYNFYLGQLRAGPATPWHYLPVWLLITVPWPYLAGVAGGLARRLSSIYQAPGRWRTLAGQLDGLVLGWLLLPILLVMGLHSVVFNGWRHLYFVYPALLLLSVAGCQDIWIRGRRSGRWRWVGLALLAGVAHVAYRQVREHPHQYVYFSWLPTAWIAQQFDRDYWGLSYHTGLQWLLAHQPTGPIQVGSPRPDLLYNNTLLLTPAQRQRLTLVERPFGPRTYVITNYARRGLLATDTVGRKIYELRVQGLPVLGIFQNENNPDKSLAKKAVRLPLGEEAGP